MHFTSRILVLKASAKTFTNAQGQQIAYNRATFINESGEVVAVTCSQAVLDKIGDNAKVEGEGVFEIQTDFRNKPRLFLASFEEKSNTKK